MAKILKIRRIEELPETLESSSLYIIKSETAGKVDLYFVGDNVADVRTILSIADVQSEIETALQTWVPERSIYADSLTNSFTLSLTGDVTGTAIITGDRDVTLRTTVVNGGGGSSVKEFIELGGATNPIGSGMQAPLDLIFTDPPNPEYPSEFLFNEGSVHSFRGVISACYYNPNREEMQMGVWDVSVTVAGIPNGRAIIVEQKITAANTTDSTDAPLPDWAIEVKVENEYVPDPESIEEGYNVYPRFLVFTFNPNYTQAWDTTIKVNGRLYVTTVDSYDPPVLS